MALEPEGLADLRDRLHGGGSERDHATIEALRKELEEHQRETLRHVRNTLGVVRTIACRPVAEGERAEDYQARLVSRLDSFARLQGHLFRDPVIGVDVYSLIADELVAFGIRPGADVQVDGDQIRLKPKAARVLGGAVHELVRLEIERGSFNANCLLRVRWILETDASKSEILLINWAQSSLKHELADEMITDFDRDVGGPVAYELGGAVVLDAISDGLNCQFRLPATWIAR